MTRVFALALAASIALYGCAMPSANAPSLLPRAIEQRSDAEPVRAPVVAAPDLALDATIAEKTKTLAESAHAFDIAATRTANLVKTAKGAGIGSESWVDAQTALAELDGYRAESLAAASDLDQIAIDRGVEGKPAYPALESLRGDATAQVAAETQRIADLATQCCPAPSAARSGTARAAATGCLRGARHDRNRPRPRASSRSAPSNPRMRGSRAPS